MSLGLQITNVSTSTILVSGERDREYIKEYDLVPQRNIQPAAPYRASYRRHFPRGGQANVLTATLCRIYASSGDADRDRFRLAEAVRLGSYDGSLLITWPDNEEGVLINATLMQAPTVRKVGTHLEIGLTWEGEEWTGGSGRLFGGVDPGTGAVGSVGFLSLESSTAGEAFLLSESTAALIKLENN